MKSSRFSDVTHLNASWCNECLQLTDTHAGILVVHCKIFTKFARKALVFLLQKRLYFKESKSQHSNLGTLQIFKAACEQIVIQDLCYIPGFYQNLQKPGFFPVTPHRNKEKIEATATRQTQFDGVCL